MRAVPVPCLHMERHAESLNLPTVEKTPSKRLQLEFLPGLAFVHHMNGTVTVRPWVHGVKFTACDRPLWETVTRRVFWSSVFQRVPGPSGKAVGRAPLSPYNGHRCLMHRVDHPPRTHHRYKAKNSKTRPTRAVRTALNQGSWVRACKGNLLERPESI